MARVTRLRLSPDRYRWVTFAALVLLIFIVISGGAVRLTGSGLGCPDWPTCDDGRVVAPWEYHAMVEFINRTITGLVSLGVIVAVLGSLVRTPRRRDLVLLSCGLVAGVVGQIVLGGLTVLFHLKPQLVMSHFLLSMVLLANAVVLHHRAGQPDGSARPVVGHRTLLIGRLVVASAAIAIFLGTIVTSSGPHGGDPDVERFDLALPDVTRVHAIGVVIFLVLTLVAIWRLNRESAPAPLRRRGEALLGTAAAQAAVGYIQYFTDVPALLVGVHIAGAAAVWVASVSFLMGFSTTVTPQEERTPAAALETVTR